MARTSSGVPYYVNHSRGITQWDHPEYIRVFEEIQAVNSVKYAAYRTACKLRRLQTRLKLHEVSLQCVASAFDGAGLRVGENNDLVGVEKVEQVIVRTLRSTYRHNLAHITLATHLTLNLLLNIYDLGRTGMVHVLGCKVLLVVLCGGRLQEKYRYLFSQVADHNNCCTRRRLASILRDLARIPELLSEQPSFGLSLVSAAVDSCFKEVEGDVGVTEEGLLDWLLREPQTLVWWTTLYRITAAELVCHDVKCGVCKQRPIIGLRYQCLRCLGYNQCQDCFLHARTSRSHKLSHPTQEYCHETSNKEWRRALVKILKHRVCGRPGDTRQRYLTIQSRPDAAPHLSLEPEDPGSWSGSLEEEEEEEEEREQVLMSRTILNTSHDSANCEQQQQQQQEREGDGGRAGEPTILPSSPRHQIHSVIMHLQDGHRQLEEGGGAGGSPAVEQHIQQLQTQINKLKAILKNFNSSSGQSGGQGRGRAGLVEGVRGLQRLESTPIVGQRGLLLNLSPIPLTSGSSHDDTAVLDNKENHQVENPKVTSQQLTPTNGCPERLPFTPRQASPPTTAAAHSLPPQQVASVTCGARLPSFTEVNFSDLTSVTYARTPAGSVSGEAGGRLGQEAGEHNTTAADIRGELEGILKQLDDIFPLTESESEKMASSAAGDGAGVVEAACELGDVLAEYVSVLPHTTTPTFHHHKLTTD